MFMEYQKECRREYQKEYQGPSGLKRVERDGVTGQAILGSDKVRKVFSTLNRERDTMAYRGIITYINKSINY